MRVSREVEVMEVRTGRSRTQRSFVREPLASKSTMAQPTVVAGST
jgi:hypothetical protein